MMAEGGQEGQGRPPGAAGAGLSRNQVLDAALQIAETEGIERLTIRGLAGKLGVAPTAIYWHVGGKDELVNLAGRQEYRVKANDLRERLKQLLAAAGEGEPEILPAKLYP